MVSAHLGPQWLEDGIDPRSDRGRGSSQLFGTKSDRPAAKASVGTIVHEGGSPAAELGEDVKMAAPTRAPLGFAAQSWAAVSGKIGNHSPALSNIRDTGPIPEGAWSFNINGLQTISGVDNAIGLASGVSRLLGQGKIGAWPTVFVAGTA